MDFEDGDDLSFLRLQVGQPGGDDFPEIAAPAGRPAASAGNLGGLFAPPRVGFGARATTEPRSGGLLSGLAGFPVVVKQPAPVVPTPTPAVARGRALSDHSEVDEPEEEPEDDPDDQEEDQEEDQEQEDDQEQEEDQEEPDEDQDQEEEPEVESEEDEGWPTPTARSPVVAARGPKQNLHLRGAVSVGRVAERPAPAPVRRPELPAPRAVGVRQPVAPVSSERSLGRRPGVGVLPVAPLNSATTPARPTPPATPATGCCPSPVAPSADDLSAVRSAAGRLGYVLTRADPAAPTAAPSFPIPVHPLVVRAGQVMLDTMAAKAGLVDLRRRLGDLDLEILGEPELDALEADLADLDARCDAALEEFDPLVVTAALAYAVCAKRREEISRALAAGIHRGRTLEAACHRQTTDLQSLRELQASEDFIHAVVRTVAARRR